MINFNSYLTEDKGGKNLHLEHIEDEILNFGITGGRAAINFVRSLRDMLAGEARSSVNMTVKWDGAPAIFAGVDPEDGKFFVAKKSVFNATPKLYKTAAEIDEDGLSGALNTKFKIALEEFSKLGITGVLQGDLMFTSEDKGNEKIDGKSFITFQPNTIVYAVDPTSDIGKQINSAKIGIVWHTTYKGNTFESMKASYGVDISKFRSKTVWSQDAMLRDLSKYTMSEKETGAVNAHLSNAGKIFNKISGTTLRTIEANPTLAQHIETHNNTYVRAGTVIGNTTRHVSSLITWISKKYQKEIDSRKTERGKGAQQAKLNALLDFFTVKNKNSLKLLFDLQKELVLAKLILINKLNKLSSVNTFVKTNKGYATTGPEGYVAIDKIGGDALKIVDRMEFSYNNFSPNVLKGWDKGR
ncbi:MAG TPA: hypothetical protein DCX27_00970 [Balneola sp.]|nr:hypothetical protein [Balneola sp.]